MSDEIPLDKMCAHGECKGSCCACDEEKRRAREQRLVTALKELEGFAKRNAERAQKAAESAAADAITTGSPRDRTAFIQADARRHEANRFYDVVKLRVAEALS